MRAAHEPRRLAFTLDNPHVLWQVTLGAGCSSSVSLLNKATQTPIDLTDGREVALVLSAAPDRVCEPLTRVCDFEVGDILQVDPQSAVGRARSRSTGLEIAIHYALDGPTRRKWVEVTNRSRSRKLVLDLELEAFVAPGQTSGGGHGFPVFLGDEAWAAVEFPAAENAQTEGRVRLRHFPGRLLRPGERLTSKTAVIGAASPGGARQAFVSYVAGGALRDARVLSVYTPFGINNQWGPCSTLDDEETLHVLKLLETWQRRGVRFDYFTLDTGWVDPSSDLTRFRPVAYPEGPAAVVERVRELGMGFGLWFATSWAAESCWAHPPAHLGQTLPEMTYLNGYPARAAYPGTLCLACETYARSLRDAVLYHVRENHARLIKLDGGHYRCDDPSHPHLPGDYSTERMHEHLVELAAAARQAAPDVFIMWYWGALSPLWALHGHTIFESGLHMEGSGTSSFPALHYRDSVTLAQDQNARHADLIPPRAKDSLGVWLADTRWGNYMGKERWREALVMDLGRGSLLFPNLWGDLYLLDEDDLRFLARIGAFAKRKASLLAGPRVDLGDPFRNEVYGYAYARGGRGLLFLSNCAFVPRRITVRLDSSIGLGARHGRPLAVFSHFPARERLLADDAGPHRMGDSLEISLRPFEVLLAEISTGGRTAERWPARLTTDGCWSDLGRRLHLRCEPSGDESGVHLLHEARLTEAGLVPRAGVYGAVLPDLDGPPPILAVAVRLRKGDEEWRYSPVVAEIVQVTARVGDRQLQLVPVPDARQFGNTQKAGCSWVVYQARLSRAWSGAPVRLALRAMLPPDVQADVEAWVVKRWWRADRRPTPDGYYADAPS